jgi:hypothetical protein
VVDERPSVPGEFVTTDRYAAAGVTSGVPISGIPSSCWRKELSGKEAW